jgi:sugar phosphate isomerase/epimerase
MFCPLGEGSIDFPSIVNILDKNNPRVLYAIECDGWNGNPGEGAEITFNYLKTKLNFA